MNTKEELRRDLDNRKSEVQLPDLASPKTLKRIRVRRFRVVATGLALTLALFGAGFAAFRSLGSSEREQPADPTPGPSGDWSLIDPAPLGSHGHASQHAFWTGESLLVIDGGHNPSSKVMRGAMYDPSRSSWRPIADPPLGRRNGYSTVWTGEQLVVWGGSGEGGVLNDGATYDPETDRWGMLPDSPLSARSGHSAVWTGTQMIVQGGSPGSGLLDDGAAYDPAEDSWTLTAPAPDGGRYDAATVWTGAQMAIWGGVGTKGMPSDGLSYDPRSDSWTRMSNSPLAGRVEAAGMWTGQEFIVWGGSSLAREDPTFSDGAAYDPSNDSWRLLSPSPLGPRQRHSFVWTGTQAFFWGGTSDEVFEGFGRPLENGAVYDPEQDSWSMLPKSPLEGRSLSSAVWTGRDVIVWGGCCVDHFDVDNFLDGATFTP